ncbi:hypothetical protein DDN76_17200, partial [Vibrio cholerae]|nr:hypothetical protein [Vibrio cholerae]
VPHPPDFLLFWQDIQDISGYPATSSWMLEVEYLSAFGRCFNAKRMADSAYSPRTTTLPWRSIRPKDDKIRLISPRSVV